MKRKIIFIAGLAHSGTTILDLCLSKNPGYLSLGEINYVFREFNRSSDDFSIRKTICSCKKDGYNCFFWSTVFDLWSEYKPQTYAQAYLIILDFLDKNFDPNLVIIDSSKYIRSMELFKQESLKKRTEIYFLHLIKDPRAQIINFIKNRTRKNKPKNMANIFLLFRRWDINHRRLELFLKSNNFRYKKVNYEELCLDHKKTIEDIYAFLNANQPLQNIKNFNKNQNHLYAGNRIRLSNLDTLEIKYDYSWFNRHEWLLPYLLFIMIKRIKK